MGLHTNEAIHYGLYDPERLTLHTVYLIYNQCNVEAGNVAMKYTKARTDFDFPDVWLGVFLMSQAIRFL